MNIRMDLSDQKTYVLGVSGGCDSMALLSLCLKQGLHVIVCHVNYRVRESADGEERLVREFCQRNGVPVYVHYPVKTDSSNFQMWAREARYAFYEEVYNKHRCDALLLGHQLDDHLENYLMALERNSHGWFYGIQEESFHHGMRILRPLLSYRKEETRQYCEENGVPYHDDESNFTDHYQRNKIRHALVETASDHQISMWLDEINEFNSIQKRKLECFSEKYSGNEISIEDFRKEEYKEDLLRWHLWNIDSTVSYSSRQLATITENILTARENGFADMGNDIILAFEYGVIYAYRKHEEFSYVLNELTYMTTPYFTLGSEGRTIEQLTVTEDDFPLTVRNWHHDDEIELRYGHKRVSRFLIDRKIRRSEREIWPVVVNKKGAVIFVCGIGCDVRHYTTKANLFVLK